MLAVNATLFIADLHLSPARPAATNTLYEFLRGEARGASALYVLGDLFDFWIGDDDLANEANERVLAAFKALANAGTAVYFLPGNRDFLLSARAAARAGMTLLPDPTTIDLFGRTSVLTHGDDLCTDDFRYQAFRSRIRSPWSERFLLSLPLFVRRGIARYARRQSEREKARKSAAIMDVNAEAVATRFRRAGCDLMIHGHTHRPARHQHLVDGTMRERWVLADWHDSGSYLRVTANTIAEMRIG
jgi:UDP-2,3-diacylglucosamine hydrolase